jgi:hypothetical protein
MSFSTSKPIAFFDAERYKVWHDAMRDEIQALCSNHTWSLVPFYPSMNVIGSRWCTRLSVVLMAALSIIRRAWLLEVLLSKKALITLKRSAQLLSRPPSD